MKEEMRRVLCYFNWRAKKWIRDAEVYERKKGRRHRGALVYANSQAYMLVGMAAKFRSLWKPIVQDFDLPSVEEPAYLLVKDNIILPKFLAVRSDADADDMRCA